jgi:hypothetical protein
MSSFIYITISRLDPERSQWRRTITEMDEKYEECAER